MRGVVAHLMQDRLWGSFPGHTALPSHPEPWLLKLALVHNLEQEQTLASER